MHYLLVIDSWIGRFCNNLTQLCNAIYLAEQTRSRLTMQQPLPQCGDWLEVGDLDFTEGETPREKVHLNSLSVEWETMGVAPPDWNSRRRILRTYVAPRLPEKLFSKEGSDGLVIYIRSGDVFGGRCKKPTQGNQFWVPLVDNVFVDVARRWAKRSKIHPDFFQPPLSFYKWIVESRPWSHVRVVAEDTRNPVIPELLRMDDRVSFQKADLQSDIATLLSAKNLAIGRGTFGITLALLSDRIQTLYNPVEVGPRAVFEELRPGDLGDIEVCAFEFENYIQPRSWRATGAQKRLMLDHKESDLVVCKHPSL